MVNASGGLVERAGFLRHWTMGSQSIGQSIDRGNGDDTRGHGGEDKPQRSSPARWSGETFRLGSDRDPPAARGRPSGHIEGRGATGHRVPARLWTRNARRRQATAPTPRSAAGNARRRGGRSDRLDGRSPVPGPDRRRRPDPDRGNRRGCDAMGVPASRPGHAVDAGGDPARSVPGDFEHDPVHGDQLTRDSDLHAARVFGNVEVAGVPGHPAAGRLSALTVRISVEMARSKWLARTPFGKSLLGGWNSRLLLASPRWRATVTFEGRTFTVRPGRRGTPDVVVRGSSGCLFDCLGDRLAYDEYSRRGRIRVSGDEEDRERWRRILILEWEE